MDDSTLHVDPRSSTPWRKQLVGLQLRTVCRDRVHLIPAHHPHPDLPPQPTRQPDIRDTALH